MYLTPPQSRTGDLSVYSLFLSHCVNGVVRHYNHPNDVIGKLSLCLLSVQVLFMFMPWSNICNSTNNYNQHMSILILKRGHESLSFVDSLSSPLVYQLSLSETSLVIELERSRQLLVLLEIYLSKGIQWRTNWFQFRSLTSQELIVLVSVG